LVAFTMEEDLQAAIRTAEAAGAILLEHFGGRPRVEWKAPGDPVTEADIAAGDLIVGELARRFPGDGILSEEEAGDPRRLERPRVWIVDPMDGTKEFIAGRDEFTVMIGLAVE